MKNEPLVSILMTAYNREKYIAEAIESVISSTYSNWELIILDDCSSDKTLEISKRYSSQDNRIRAYQNSENLGQFRNRNRIVNYAKGEYLKYLDSDDLLYPYGLELIMYYMTQFPEAGYGLFSLKPDVNRPYPMLLSPRKAYERYYLEKTGIFNRAPLSSIIKKSAFTQAGGFPHEAVSGDFAMWNQMSLNHNLLLIPATAVWYRTHEDQEMQKVRNDYIQEFEYMKVARHYLNRNDCPLDRDNREKLLKQIQQRQTRFIISKTVRKGIKAGFQLKKYEAVPFHLISPGN